ncbi:fungal-specific transcription factor domain-containing protein [Biscogniauxia sp. FL1348]|nr:fungal-specific transcription factor domain-containing protein [Biscogniauxia sp. FL1348]
MYQCQLIDHTYTYQHRHTHTQHQKLSQDTTTTVITNAEKAPYQIDFPVMQRINQSGINVLSLEGESALSSPPPAVRDRARLDNNNNHNNNNGADLLSQVWDLNFLINDALSGASTAESRAVVPASPQSSRSFSSSPSSSSSSSSSPSNNSEESIRTLRDRGQRVYNPRCQPRETRIPPTPDDHASWLVEEWFRSVCSMWSGFDSASNMNRKLARDAWARSEAVMHSLQSMSAICLSTQMPQLRQSAVWYLRLAVAAIQRDIAASYELQSSESATDLLFALCCVGTASCWVDTRIIGARFLRDAKILLKRMNERSGSLSAEDRQKMYFFNNSLTYWNMLVAVVSDEPDELGIPRLKNLTTATQPLPAGQITPHPWTGISSTVQLLFMRTMRLCRQYRRFSKHHHHQSQSRAHPDIRSTHGYRAILEAAHRVEEELLGLVHHQVSTFSDTGDSMSPILHLIDVAEAYRLASLLQLYQTFPELGARRLPRHSPARAALWSDCITPLSFRLIDILKGIPATSGTRCIQPLLYLSAGTGLRFDPDTLAYMQRYHRAGMGGSGANTATTTTAAAGIHRPDDNDNDHEKPPISRQSVEVTHARRFILGRLSLLEHCLPPAPILVARDLVRKVWEAYDSERVEMGMMGEAEHVHWIDVMERSNLQTIFG